MTLGATSVNVAESAATGRPARRRPRLLFLAQTLPFPPDGGVNIRTYHILRLLAAEFDVTALCFYRATERPTAAAVRQSLAALGRLCEIEAFAIPQERSVARYLWDHARSATLRRAYTLFAYESSTFRRRLGAALASRSFDLVHVDSLDLAGYLPALAGLPVVCVHHNVESQLLARRASVERAAWRRAYLRLQSRLLEELERRHAGGVALNVMVSEADAETLGAMVPAARRFVVPNGVDTEAFTPGGEERSDIVCVGGINGFANRDGLEWLGSEVLPRLRAARPGARATWVGRASAAERQAYRSRFGIELTGYVGDVRPYVREARCYVVPLRVGGGTRLKVLDAWAMGRAVVSTSLGCEGLAAEHGANILVADDAADFSSAVVRVLGDPVLRTRLGAAARATAEAHYSWRSIGRAMLPRYLELVAKARRG